MSSKAGKVFSGSTPDEAQGKALTTRETQLPAEMNKLFAQDAGAGFEDMEQEDYALPFVVLLQALSPQLDPTNGAYDPNAKPGSFVNTVTGEVYHELHVIPCAYAFRVIERKPRNQGGGFVMRYTREEAPQDGIRNDKGELVRPNGNVLVNTAYHYVLVKGEEFPSQAVLSLKSTQIGKSKKWNAKMSALKVRGEGGKIFTPPMFSSEYKITSGKESNEHGSWFGWNIEREGFLSDPDTLGMARQFAEVALGKKLAAESTADEVSPAPASTVNADGIM